MYHVSSKNIQNNVKQTTTNVTSFFAQLDAQLDCSRSVQTYIKMLLHVSA